MIITIKKGATFCSGGVRDHMSMITAINMIEESLFEFLAEPSANNRLRYELRTGSLGSFLPHRAESGAVQLSIIHWVHLVELPCAKPGSIVTSDGKKQLSHALMSRILRHTNSCSVEVFAHNPSNPLNKCRPYLFIQGRKLEEVDMAAAIITNSHHVLQIKDSTYS